MSFSFWDLFIVDGAPVNGATVAGYLASRFITTPALGTSPPGSPDTDSVTTGPQSGQDGAYLLDVPNPAAYWVGILNPNDDNYYWRLVSAAMFQDTTGSLVVELTGEYSSDTPQTALSGQSLLTDAAAGSERSAATFQSSGEAYLDDADHDHQVALNIKNWTANGNGINVFNPAQGDGIFIHASNNLPIGDGPGAGGHGNALNIYVGDTNNNGSTTVSTTLMAEANVGDTQISTFESINPGSQIQIGVSPTTDYQYVTASTPITGGYQLTLASELQYLHPSGRPVKSEPVICVGIYIKRFSQGSGLIVQNTTEAGSTSQTEPLVQMVSNGNPNGSLLSFDSGALVVNPGGVLQFSDSLMSSGASAGAAALPANPVGFFLVQDSGGTTRKIPYYAI